MWPLAFFVRGVSTSGQTQLELWAEKRRDQQVGIKGVQIRDEGDRCEVMRRLGLRGKQLGEKGVEGYDYLKR